MNILALAGGVVAMFVLGCVLGLIVGPPEARR
jgi:hypothetical protein